MVQGNDGKAIKYILESINEKVISAIDIRERLFKWLLYLAKFQANRLN